MTRRCVAYFGVVTGDERGVPPVGEGPLRVPALRNAPAGRCGPRFDIGTMGSDHRYQWATRAQCSMSQPGVRKRQAGETLSLQGMDMGGAPDPSKSRVAMDIMEMCRKSRHRWVLRDVHGQVTCRCFVHVLNRGGHGVLSPLDRG